MNIFHRFPNRSLVNWCSIHNLNYII